MKNVLTLTNEQKGLLSKASLVYRAINHKLRCDILDYVALEGKTVTDIYTALRLEQSVASQHLAILRNAGLVTRTRKGKEMYYETDHLALHNLISSSIDVCNKVINLNKI